MSFIVTLAKEISLPTSGSVACLVLVQYPECASDYAATEADLIEAMQIQSLSGQPLDGHNSQDRWLHNDSSFYRLPCNPMSSCTGVPT